MRRRLGAIVLLVAAALIEACGSGETAVMAKPAVRLVRDATIGEALEREYAARLPGIAFRRVDAVGSVGTVEAIQQHRADAGFVLGDVAYFTHLRAAESGGRAVQLRGMAALQLAPIHLVVRPGVAARTIGDLRGKRIGVGSALSGQTLLTGLIFTAYHLGHEIVQPGPRTNLLTDVDASFATGYYPVTTVTSALMNGARLLPIEGDLAEHLQRDYPFVQLVTIPANAYPNQTEAVRTIGVGRMLVCRSDLDDRVVHDLTRHFLEALPSLTATVSNSLRLTDLSLASATAIPLHDGAAQYYRERELTR